MTGAELIARERQRQIEEEGWTAEHDSQHNHDELVMAAVCYAVFVDAGEYTAIPESWPWSDDWWKPTGNRIRNLEKAGALIAAEIDRLQRLEAHDGTIDT